MSLLDKYEVYQQLMEYWEESMQDDVYSVAYDGWEAGREIVKEFVIKKNKDKTVTHTDRIKAWEGRMIPKSLLIDIYFPENRDGISRLEAQREEVQHEMEEMRGEYGGEEGLLCEVTIKDKISAKRLKERIRAIDNCSEDQEELKLLLRYEALLNKEAKFSTEIKNSHAALEKLVLNKYQALTITEIQELVIEKKWCTCLLARINSRFFMLSQHLADRITILSERYATPLPELKARAREYEEKVTSHLERMGFLW